MGKMVLGAVAVVVAAQLVGVPAAQARGSEPLPRIQITASGFVNSATGARWVARGANHLRLTEDGSLTDTWYLSTFEPGVYSKTATMSALAKAKARGDNVFRVLMDVGKPLDRQSGPPHGLGRGLTDIAPVNMLYMRNVADFVLTAASYGIYTVPVVYRLPENCFYYRLAHSSGWCGTRPDTENVEGRNAFFLDAGYIAAKREYLKQFASTLVALIGLGNASDVLAYEAENEAVWQTDRKPWSLDGGLLTPVTGYTYDLSDPAGRQQAADASLVKYTLAAKAGQMEGDPTGYLTMGFFTHRAAGKSGPDGFAVHCSTTCDPFVDYRYPLRGLIAGLHGALDAVDVHVYPRAGAYSAVTDLESAEMQLLTTKPWFVGEVGAFRDVFGGSATAAGEGLRTTRADSCAVGRGPQGWLTWTDQNQDNPDQRRLFTLLDAPISSAMSAATRPDGCVR